MGKKRRKHRIFDKIIYIDNIPQSPELKIITKKFESYINLTPEDRIIYIYEKNLKGDITKVVDVSYDSFISNNWVTIIRFDSEHGHLHYHKRISINNLELFVSEIGVIKKGTPKKWLTWAINNIKTRYLDYKNNFFA